MTVVLVGAIFLSCASHARIQATSDGAGESEDHVTRDCSFSSMHCVGKLMCGVVIPFTVGASCSNPVRYDDCSIICCSLSVIDITQADAVD